jgi:hypothetical protein
MMILRQVLGAAFALLVLSGCYVYATVPPAPNGPAIDERLVGAWIGLDEKGKPMPNAFLHFTKPKNGGPMHMVTTETDDFDVFELHVANAGGLRIFAVRELPTGPDPAPASPDPSKYVLGAYEIRGDALVIRVFDPTKVRPAVVERRVTGKAESGDFASVALTGSPDEITKFLATPEANAALSEPRTIARRVPHPR